MKGDLQYDVQADGRYYDPTQSFQEGIDKSYEKRAPASRTAALARHGISESGHIFGSIFPCLHPFTSYPNDPMHAEIRLAKYFQIALLEDVFSVAGVKAYLEAWERVNVPYGWYDSKPSTTTPTLLVYLDLTLPHIATHIRGQPQNPISHKGSMVFTEHGRLAELNPFALLLMFDIRGNQSEERRVRFKDNKSFFKQTVVSKLSKEFDHHEGEFDPAASILQVSYSIAQVVYYTHKASLTPEETAALPQIVIQVCDQDT